MALVVARPPRRPPCPGWPACSERSDTLGLATWTPESVNLPESQARLAALGADLLVVCDYGEILRPATLATARLGGINLHGSLLPKYRGAAPVQWAILRGETETGNTVIQMTPGLDAGPCLAQERTPIDPEEDAGDARSAVSGAGRPSWCSASSTSSPRERRGQSSRISAEASKAPRLTKEHGAIDWSRSAQEIKNLVRAVKPWPRAYTFWHRGEGPPCDSTSTACQLVGSGRRSPRRPGDRGGTPPIASSSPRATALLELLEVQPAGKRAMTAAEFLRGHRVAVGDRLGGRA